MLLDHLESVRHRSAQARISYAFFFALGTTGVVVVVWLSTLLVREDAPSQTASGIEAVESEKPSLKDIPGATKAFLKEYTDDTINWDTLLPPPAETSEVAPAINESASTTLLMVPPFATGTGTTVPSVGEVLQGTTTGIATPTPTIISDQ